MPTPETKNAPKYLTQCLILENQAAQLYTLTTNKIHQQSLRTASLTIAYDCLKHAQTIKLLLNFPQTNNTELDQKNTEFKKILNEIKNTTNKLQTINTINEDEIPNYIKSLADLEDFFYTIYNNFLETELHQQYNYNTDPRQVTAENLAYIIESFKDDNQRHREILIQSLYFFNKTQTKNIQVDTTPMVRYQNPEAWIMV